MGILAEEGEEVVIFVGFEAEGVMLGEAQRLGLLKRKKAKTPEAEEARNKRRKEQQEYLHPRIIEAERKRPYLVSFKAYLLMKYYLIARRMQRSPFLKVARWTPF